MLGLHDLGARFARLRCKPLAEEVGFEPTEAFTSHAFQACRFGHSRTLPRRQECLLLSFRHAAGAHGEPGHHRSMSPRPPRSCIWRRIAAYLVDLAMFGAVAVPALWFTAGSQLRADLSELILLKNLSAEALGLDPTAASVPLRPALTVLVLLATCLGWAWYRVQSSARWGASVGKYVFGLEVVDAETLEPGIGRSRGIKRWAPSQALALIPVPGIGMVCYVTALFNPRQQGLHDRAAGTLVVLRQRRA